MSDQLGVNAKEFARQYVPLVEELKKQGVLDEEAREVARRTALDMMFDVQPTEGEACPLCGK